MTEAAPVPGRGVAVIGLGAMGMPVAVNLLRAGFDVAGVDRNPAACAAFAEAGGRIAATPAAAARGAQALFVLVVNAAQACAVLFEAEGGAAHLAPGAVVVLCATMSPADASEIGARLAAIGIDMVEAPVSGGVRRAADGALTIIAAGTDQALAKAAPFLAPLGKVFAVGPVLGKAAAVKLLNQMLCGIHIAATAEAIAMAERLGLDPRLAYEVITSASGMSRMFQDRAPLMLEAEPPVSSALDLFVKDLGLALELGRSVGAHLPLSATAERLFKRASAAGAGARNDSEIVRLYRGPAL
jgi:3-hydroxyisobutyrate dehydrogenase